MNLNELAAKIHATAVEKGWWDTPRSFAEVIALCHSELSEALEDHRAGYDSNATWFKDGRKPCGIPIELADCIIRILDACHKWDIDIDQAMQDKMAYNETRPYKHGGKRC